MLMSFICGVLIVAKKSPDKFCSLSTNDEGLIVFTVYFWAFICGQRWEWRFHSCTTSSQTLKVIREDLDKRALDYKIVKTVVDLHINQVELGVY